MSTRYKAQVIYAYGRSSEKFVYHENKIPQGRILRLEFKGSQSLKEREWIEYSLEISRQINGDRAIDIVGCEDPTPKPPERVKPRISQAIDKAALLAEMGEYGTININPYTETFGIGFEMVTAGELIITKHGSDYYELSRPRPFAPISNDHARVLLECAESGLVEVIGEQVTEEEEQAYELYDHLKSMGLIYCELQSASGVLFAKYQITEFGKKQISAHIPESHYHRAARLESEMDACSASGDHEGAAVKRTLMQAALWDWYQATKRGEK